MVFKQPIKTLVSGKDENGVEMGGQGIQGFGAVEDMMLRARGVQVTIGKGGISLYSQRNWDRTRDMRVRSTYVESQGQDIRKTNKLQMSNTLGHEHLDL